MTEFKKRASIGALVASIAIGSAIAGVATSQAEEGAATPPRQPATAHTKALQGDKPEPKGLELLQKVTSYSNHHVDLLVEEGKILEEGFDYRYTVVPTKDGSLCDQLDYRGAPITAGCTDTFPKTGVLATTVHGVGPEKVFGIVTDDVTRALLIDSTGTAHELDIQDGSFWWSQPGVEIEKVVSVRDGKRIEDASPSK